MRSTPVRVLAATALVGATACSQTDLRKQYREMRPAMQRGDWQTASAQLEKAKEKIYGESDAVMYWLNMGTLLHYARAHDQSNEHLVKAEAKIQELWTTSISAEATKLLVNEAIQDYAGEDYEKVLIYLYTSLNNIGLGKFQDAVVEGRRADEMLRKMQIQFEKEGEGGTIYKQDAFMLWLVGMYYEVEGSGLQDALLAYKAAYKAYKEDYAGNFGMPPPKFLGEDIVRVATILGQGDEATQYKTETGATGETVDALKESGEVIIIHGNGESPFKRELRFDGQMPDGNLTSIAIPEFVEIPPQVQYVEVAAGEKSARSELAEPVTAIVLKNFEHRLPAIKARAVARMIAKYAISKGAGGVAGAIGGDTVGKLFELGTSIAGAATEAADLRSWTLLPANFGVARLWLPAGQHEITINYKDAGGNNRERTDKITVEVKAGQRQIFSVRSVE